MQQLNHYGHTNKQFENTKELDASSKGAWQFYLTEAHPLFSAFLLVNPISALLSFLYNSYQLHLQIRFIRKYSCSKMCMHAQVIGLE